MAIRTVIQAVASFTAFFAISIAPISHAAQCTPLSIGLWHQVDIDNFQQEHGPCDRLNSLYIEGDDITNLEGLSEIVDLTWSLQIVNNPLLNDISGLSALTRVGTLLLIQRNPALSNLDGLAALTEIGEALGLVNNDGLETTVGLSSLVNVGCAIQISHNALLKSVNGLSSLIEVGSSENTGACTPGFAIYENPSLTDLDGLQSLERLGNHRRGSAHLIIQDNAELVHVSSLTSLQEVFGFLSISRNPKLALVSGLNSLTVLGEGLGIGHNASLKEIQGPALLEGIGGLEIRDNNALAAISGFQSLNRIYGHLEIAENGVLSDLFDLMGLLAVTGRLEVQSNPSLMHCQVLARLVDAIDDAEPGPGPGAGGVPDVGLEVSLGGNLPGCNTIEEILTSEQLKNLNAGLNDAWFNPDTNGQGFLIVVLPSVEQVFLSWFTYDAERPPAGVSAHLGDPGHRWLTAQGGFENNQALLDVWMAHGGIFDSEEPIPELYQDGDIMLEFKTCNSGTVTYDISSIKLQGQVPIERIATDNVGLCYQLDAETR